jgi:lipid A 3-O-deacylase
MPKKSIILLLMGLCLSQDCFSAEKKESDNFNTFNFSIENDDPDRTDRQYTSGFRFTWISKDLRTYKDDGTSQCNCPFFFKLPFMNEPDNQKNTYFSIGQSIYTPDNLKQRDLIKDDRPYAGITYLAFGFISRNVRQMDTFEIETGIVGTHSYASYVQDVIHDWLHESYEVMGWKNQLKDEPILNLYYGRTWKLAPEARNGYAYDFIPRAGISAGNLLIAGSLGAEVRFGLNLPNDFGTFRIGPGSETTAPIHEKGFSSGSMPFGAHFYLGYDVTGVARNLFLDGNTFRDSPSIKKKPVVRRLFAGAGITMHRIKITFSNVWQTREFYVEKRPERYGSLIFTYYY